MSKHQVEFVIPLSLEDSSAACREAIAATGWRVMEQTETRFVCKEISPQSTSLTNPSKVEILLMRKSSNETNVVLNGSILGFGPFQSGHLKGQVGNIQNKIELFVKKTSPSSGDPSSISLADELEKLHNLKTQGILSEDDYQQAKSQILKKRV
ncbi:MAG: SHOCT domain-containing protein [Candidatus Cloacimonadaceae bacterium]|nr:SHOCT domain-containing protein [Candidatus Cloacimonadaceae bacterium]